MRIEIDDADKRTDPMVDMDVPFVVHALNRLPWSIRGKVMTAVFKAAKKQRPSEAEKALLSLFTNEERCDA